MNTQKSDISDVLALKLAHDLVKLESGEYLSKVVEDSLIGLENGEDLLKVIKDSLKSNLVKMFIEDIEKKDNFLPGEDKIDKYLNKYNKLLGTKTIIYSDRLCEQENSIRNCLMYSIFADTLKKEAHIEYQREVSLLNMVEMGPSAYRLAEENLRKRKKEKLSFAQEFEKHAYTEFFEASKYRVFYSPLFENWKFFNTWDDDTNFKPDILKATSKLIELFYNGELSDVKNRVLKGSLLTVDVANVGASVYTDILTDYFLIGKVSLATQFTRIIVDTSQNAVTQNQDATIQNLIAGGGNISLNYNIPLFNFNFGGTRLEDASIVFGMSQNLLRLGFPIPALGQVNTSPAIQIETGLESYFSFQFLNKVLGIYGNYKMSLISGSPNYLALYQGLDTDFLFVNQFVIGINIKDMFRIGVSWFFGNQFVVDNFPQHVLSITVVP